MKILLAVTIILMPCFAYPHGGGLDSYGCHHNRKEGGYHCHRGENRGESFSSKNEMLGSVAKPAGKEIEANDSKNNELSKGGSYQGEVVGITDGDTLTILINEAPYKIRLAQIDTPEKLQPYGSKAKKVLSDLVFNKTISIKIETIDRYGRYVADIYFEGQHVNAEMVKLGAAWVYRKYVKDESLYDVENEAKAAKIGIWSLPKSEQVPPWEWRRNN
jgi:micrococcal nuclease